MDRTPAVERSGQLSTEALLLSALGYLPTLFFLPLLASRPSDFTRFHSRQSLLLLLVFMALWFAIWIVDLVFGRVMGSVVLLGFLFRAVAWVIHNIVGLGVSALYLAAVIAGTVNAGVGRRWRVPGLETLASRTGFEKLFADTKTRQKGDGNA